MRSRFKNKTMKRFTAALLSMMLVFSLIPVSSMTGLAAGDAIVDTISPEMEVSYQTVDEEAFSQNIDGRYYFQGDVEVTVKITKANFSEEDVTVEVAAGTESPNEMEVSWGSGNGQDSSDVHIGTCIIKAPENTSEDYVVTMKYKDQDGGDAGTPVEVYRSGAITIDTAPPIVAFDYSNNLQAATIQITEHNFRASDIQVETTAKDILGQAVAVQDFQNLLRNAKWGEEGDVHTLTISEDLADAVYHMTISYSDLAGNSSGPVNSGDFTVDHAAPSDLEMSYSDPITEKIYSGITYKYYHTYVEVTFTARDATSGVDHFTWSYLREEGASGTNAEKLEGTAPAEQSTEDASLFTATVKIPLENEQELDNAGQLRGNLTYSATDKNANESDKVTDDGQVVVVDTIAPEMTVEYIGSSRTVEEPDGTGRMYFNQDVTARFSVTETNFYPEDVVAGVSKEGVDTDISQELDWQQSGDTYVAVYTLAAPEDHSGDGNYRFHVQYTDRSGNEMSVADKNDNEVSGDEYTSDIITIDTVKPVINVTYSDKNPVSTLEDSEHHTREYYDSTRSATITVTEHNFKADEVDFTILAKDAAGNLLDAGSLSTKSSWSVDGDQYTITITYPGDANYTFDVAYADLAQNKAADYAADYFTIDKTAPTGLDVSYSSSVLETVLQAVSFGFYNAKMTVTIRANDDISGVHSFQYSYQTASGVSSVNAGLANQTIDETGIIYSNGRETATARFTIPKAALGNGNQFNGSVSFHAKDRVGNASSQFKDGKRVVVDNITPTATVEYNSPVQTADGVAYYDGAVNATVTIQEANFYPEDVRVSVTRDGASYSVTPSWSDHSTDVHTGTFSLTDDGDYVVTVNYADKSGNRMAEYTSGQMTVDTEITEPVITVNGEEADGKAFKDEVLPAVNFEDVNFENYEINLTRTRYDDKNADVTETFIGGNVSLNDQGGTGTFDTFEKEPEIDGIYTMTVSMTDRAGHSAETTATFTVNRFGSVYEYSDYLVSLIGDGGAYVQGVEEDLLITEYNADRLLSGSLDIEISCDGKPLSDVDYELTPQINDKVSVGNSGWYQYEYTISKENFDTDGVYKIAVSSKDATGNTPETTNYEDKNILFRVDSTAPEINSITGLEDSIINAQDVTAKYTVYDTIGLASVKVYVDGEILDTVTDFTGDANNYTGNFVVSEKSSAQSVRLVVEDLAGNVTDTDSEEFESAFAFSSLVTVSTSFFVRFYANKMLFWGTVTGVIVIIALIAFLITKRSKKKEEKEAGTVK